MGSMALCCVLLPLTEFCFEIYEIWASFGSDLYLSYPGAFLAPASSVKIELSPDHITPYLSPRCWEAFKISFSKVGAMLVPPKPPAPALTGVHVLRLTAEQGYGHFPARQGQVIGPTERYRIVWMVGCGTYSCVFLVEDLRCVPL